MKCWKLGPLSHGVTTKMMTLFLIDRSLNWGIRANFDSISILSFTLRLTKVDVLTYYPTKLDYHPISVTASKSTNMVSLKIGQVSFYEYDDEHEKDDLYKGNMFLSFHANIYSALKHGEPIEAAQFDA
ncbi:unnamed protein product [Ambrosiozyma monospora]|uniref:Unnamed protein product n=1 Tax=Ambrosiozyma monospora TaxID=43982 RepID=A0ACB5UA36_AMBMO|nr:unnamed protein product [Ambrosiozyma monospora]